MADAAFEGRSLVKVFGELRAVDGITLAVQRGEIYGLVGPSGAGKTTLIRMLCGLTTPSSGEARLLGHVMPKERRAVESRFGYMPQERAVYRDLSVGENLLFFGRIYGMPRAAVSQRTRELLALMRLADRAKQLCAHLSGGEKQRLSLACSLIHEPDALLLDEPTIGLDPALRIEFWEHFRKLAAAGRTLLVSTHYVHEAERCGRVGLVQRGRLAAEGTPPDLKAWASSASGGPVSDMEDVFLILCRAEGGLR